MLPSGLFYTLGVALGIWSLPLAADTQGFFAPPRVFAAGDRPHSVATADFNGDGKTDLVTANYYSRNVSVLLGNGTGGFGPQAQFAVGIVPLSVATADFNGDGKTDLVTANSQAHNVSVLFGNGRGGFSPQTKFASGLDPLSVATADFNGDGHTDLVTANQNDEVWVRLSNGSGGFDPQIRYVVGGFPHYVATTDFNGDGHTDLVTANSGSANVSVLLGNGRGGFGPQTQFAVGENPHSVATADFNGDGHVDLVTANGGSANVSVLLGNGTGDFGPQTQFAVGKFPVSVATSDFNGDGHTDLVTGNWYDSVSVLLGNGRGGFGPQTQFAAGEYPNFVATADFNGDGHTDLVAANHISPNVNANISVLLNTTPPFLFTSLSDVDGDSRPEIAAALYDMALHETTATVKNASTGALVKQMRFNGQFVPKRIAVVPDLNSNGAMEIALLAVRDSDQAVQVEIRDSLSGLPLISVPFPATFSPLSLSVMSNNNSCSSKVCLAVLQRNDTALRVQMKDALSGAAIRSIGFSSGFNGGTFRIIADLNGNNRREFALLADDKTPGAAYQLEIRDSKSGALLRTISYPLGEPVRGLLKLADLNQNGGTDLASVLPHISQVVVVDSKTGSTLNTIDTTLTKPFMLSRETDSGSENNVALLGVRPSDGQNVAEVYDSLTGAVVHSIVFSQIGTTLGFRGIPDVNGNGSSEMVRLKQQPGTPEFIAEIRDSATGELIKSIGF